MLRAITNADRLNNRNLCGIDESYCYPIQGPRDVAVYYKLPDTGNWELAQVSVYDYRGNLVKLMNSTQLLQYFAVLIAEDSKGDAFIIIRQVQPIYNYDGVQPEVTCYSLGLVVQGDTTTVTLETEPVCTVAKYNMTQYTVAYAIGDVADLEFTIDCDGVTYSFGYEDVPIDAWIEYTGPFVDLFLPTGCQLTQVTGPGGPVSFIPTARTFGQQSCQSYVRLTTSGEIRFDCEGRYFQRVDNIQTGTSNMTQVILRDKTDDQRPRLDLLDVNIQNGLIRQIDGVSRIARVRESCYVSHAEKVERYKIYSTCAVPPWFQREVNNVASMQRVALGGTSPLLDDYEEYIELLQSDESAWRTRPNGQYAYPSLIFETCTCYKNFIC